MTKRSMAQCQQNSLISTDVPSTDCLELSDTSSSLNSSTLTDYTATTNVTNIDFDPTSVSQIITSTPIVERGHDRSGNSIPGNENENENDSSACKIDTNIEGDRSSL